MKNKLKAVLIPICFFLLAMLTALLTLPSSVTSIERIAVLTQHNDNNRTGANLEENILTTSNVNKNLFGKLFSRSVDGQIYAQPLYLSGLDLPSKGIRNVVYVATQHNSVYAFDADNPNANEPLWQVNLGTSASVPNDDFGNQHGPYQDIQIEVGITSTPVISLDNDTLYVVALTKENSRYFHRLHALDLHTGQEKCNGPVVIQGAVTGNGVMSQNGLVAFDSKQQLQRPALLLSDGVVYIAFGSYGDTDPYHGWLFGYNASNLQRAAIFNTTPNGWKGGIWQSGQGIAVDKQGFLYFISGVGEFNANEGGTELSDSFIKLKPLEKGLMVADWFTPYNQALLNIDDIDVGSNGVMLIPNTTLLIGGSKAGVLYLLNRDNLGHFQAENDNQIVQSLQISRGNIHGTPVFWKDANGSHIYVWPENDTLKSFRLVDGRIQITPTATSNVFAPEGMPGGILSISANEAKPGTGIVWATLPYSGDANKTTRPGILRAFDAGDVSKELWNSKLNFADELGSFAKFCPPTIANGKVYVATFSGQLMVYGLR